MLVNSMSNGQKTKKENLKLDSKIAHFTYRNKSRFYVSMYTVLKRQLFLNYYPTKLAGGNKVYSQSERALFLLYFFTKILSLP